MTDTPKTTTDKTTRFRRAWLRFWNFRHHGVSFSKAFDRAFR